MPKSIRQYCSSNPVERHHQKAGEKVATRSSNPMSAGWAWNPDEETTRQIAASQRKMRKLKKAKLEMEGDTPMATKKAAAKKTTTKKTTAKKTTKKTTAKKVASKKTSNLIPLKKICQELKLDPKMARRTLRDSKPMMKIHDAKGRWEFTEAQAKKVKEVLSA